MQQLPLRVGLRERATFANFIETANPQAVQRLQALALQGSGVIWLWGRRGCGKSHLLQAVCAAAPAARRVLYLPLRGSTGPVAPRLEGAGLLDVLCIDDLAEGLCDADFERRLFSSYRLLEERHGLLLVSADTPPAAMPWRLADIGSRFAASEVYALQWLDEEDQCRALQRHASSRGMDLPIETARFLCARLPRDLSRLIETLEHIDAASLSAQRRLTIPFMREVLGEP